MRRISAMLVLVVAAGALAGCHSVYSDKPFGDKPVALTPSDWEGKWLCMGDWVTIRVLDAENGLLELTPPTSAPEPPVRVSIRQSGEWHFANIHEPVDSKEGDEKATEENADEEAQEEALRETHYLWGRISNSDNQLIFWLPDALKFEDLVEAGKLPGKATRKNHDLTVTLQGLTAEHVNLIMSEKEGRLFKWDRPVALVRGKPAEEANAPPSEEQSEAKTEE